MKVTKITRLSRKDAGSKLILAKQISKRRTFSNQAERSQPARKMASSADWHLHRFLICADGALDVNSLTINRNSLEEPRRFVLACSWGFAGTKPTAGPR